MNIFGSNAFQAFLQDGEQGLIRLHDFKKPSGLGRKSGIHQLTHKKVVTLVWNQPFFGGGSDSRSAEAAPRSPQPYLVDGFHLPKRSLKKKTLKSEKNDDMGTNPNTLWTNEGLEVLLLIRQFVNFCIKPGTLTFVEWITLNLHTFAYVSTTHGWSMDTIVTSFVTS